MMFLALDVARENETYHPSTIPASDAHTFCPTLAEAINQIDSSSAASAARAQVTMDADGAAPLNAPTVESVAARAQAAAEELNRLVPNVQDKTYEGVQRRYFAWVEQQRRGNVLPPGDRFLTRENVDLYFNTVVAFMNVQPDTARRVVSALQRHADRVEYVGSDHKFIVDGNQVKQALERQAQLCVARSRLVKKDSHKNLSTDMLTDDERVRAVVHILESRALNWKEMCLAWTACETMMLRNSSLLKMLLVDLITNHTHGPNVDGDRTMIALLYRKFEHKERQKRDRIVGAWRHKNWLLCFTGHLAMGLFVRLYNDLDINFYDGEGDAIPSWWQSKLVAGWRNMEAARDAYVRLLHHCKITWQKCTHIRKSGTERASADGELTPHEVASMSKHSMGESGKLLSVYFTELFKPVLRVMAGFSKDGAYNVPRTRIGIGNSFGREAVDIVFPRRRIWLQQHASRNGDKSEAARNFLFDTLPFLAKVVIQDGCFWINKFPRHEASLLLLQVMPPSYPQWARSKREWVKRRMGKKWNCLFVTLMLTTTSARQVLGWAVIACCKVADDAT